MEPTLSAADRFDIHENLLTPSATLFVFDRLIER